MADEVRQPSQWSNFIKPLANEGTCVVFRYAVGLVCKRRYNFATIRKGRHPLNFYFKTLT